MKTVMGNCNEPPAFESEDDEIFEECDACSSARPHKAFYLNGASSGNLLWPDGIIHYELDHSLDVIRNRILKAMREIESYSRIRFVPRRNEDIFLKITREDGCYFYHGSFGHPMVSLGFGCERYGTILHELLHAIGFPHEQRRPDRDDYIIVHEENIEPGEESQFKKLQYDEYKWSHLPFDYNSVMLYSEYAFSKNNLKTIEVIKEGTTIGQRNGLSKLDIKKLKII